MWFRFLMLWLLAVATSLGGVFPAVAAAGQIQIMKASLEGTITDPQGQVIPGADILLLGLEHGQSWSLVSDGTGRYVQDGLEPGPYRLEIRMPGFAEITRPLVLHTGESMRLNVQLQLAGSAEQIVVSADRLERSTSYSSPARMITREQIESMNTATVEGVVGYQPSLAVRRRFIGDPNGVLGMRGANMFQTARSMVLADGIPLHNPLQTRWNGAPRWSLVAPDEVETVELIYGPFSAEHGGNAMGGVVKLKTVLPQKREIRLQGDLFSQPSRLYGRNDLLNGYRVFTSYGDRFGRFSFQVFHNHLQNSGQPQNFNGIDDTLGPPSGQPVVSGAVSTLTRRGRPAVIYGDSGPEDVRTDLLKFKGGYEFSPRLFTQLTLAYEDRAGRRDEAKNYLRDSLGDTLWGDGNYSTRMQFPTERLSTFAMLSLGSPVPAAAPFLPAGNLMAPPQRTGGLMPSSAALAS